MHRFRTHKRQHRFLSSPLTLAVLLVLAALLGRAAWGAFAAYRDAARARSIIEARTTELEAHAVRLEESAALLGSARAAEEDAREKLRLARPGEEVIIVVKEEPRIQEGDAPLEHKPWWQRLTEWLTK